MCVHAQNDEVIVQQYIRAHSHCSALSMLAICLKIHVVNNLVASSDYRFSALFS